MDNNTGPLTKNATLRNQDLRFLHPAATARPRAVWQFRRRVGSKAGSAGIPVGWRAK